MIGSALKKLAAKNGLTVSGGIAFGSYQGYAISLSEGSGYKLLTISTHLTGSDIQWLQSQLDSHNLTKEFRVRDTQFDVTGIQVVFNDNPGTMKRFEAFLQWFFPLLSQSGASGYTACCRCGQPFGGEERWKMIGDLPMHIHPACAEALLRTADQEREAELRSGSYGKGLLGALLGGLIGAALWALILYLGYIASVAGLVIGLLAELFYEKFGGKNGKGKIPILLLAVVFGVVLGTIAGDALQAASMISSGDLFADYSDIFPLLLDNYFYNAEYTAAVNENLLMGLVFAILGVAGTLYKAYKDTKQLKSKDM